MRNLLSRKKINDRYSSFWKLRYVTHSCFSHCSLKPTGTEAYA